MAPVSDVGGIPMCPMAIISIPVSGRTTVPNELGQIYGTERGIWSFNDAPQGSSLSFTGGLKRCSRGELRSS